MDPNNQAIAQSYAYYSSGDEGPVMEDYSTGMTYAHHPSVQHQFTMQGTNINQVHAPIQLQMQPQQPQPTYIMHPSVPVAHVAYPMNTTTGIVYHQSITSPPPPPSPYDPTSPAPSDHSGTESIGATPLRAGGVPVMPTRVYHAHSHSHSSQSSTSSLHGESHPYAAPLIPYPPRRPSTHNKTNSLDRRSISITPPPQNHHPYHGSDDDFDRADTHDPYINQVSLLNRKESTRRQRIQAEQRRRDELRDGYSKLRDVLPPSNSKSSKVSLIERARAHIIDLDAENASLKDKVDDLMKEVQRLQQLSDQMALSVAVPLAMARPPV
ncbi:hypothetical protein FRC17_009120, partial [Serendipita sp. 399]